MTGKTYVVQVTRDEFLGRWGLNEPMTFVPLSHASTYTKDEATRVAEEHLRNADGIANPIPLEELM